MQNLGGPILIGIVLICTYLPYLCGAFDVHRSNKGSAGTLDLIKSRGFKAELYTLTIVDHPLTLYRIINPLANPNTLNKYPVLYGHGILYDAESMMSRSEHARPRRPMLGQPTINFGGGPDGSDDHSLPFMLSNNNFDVWMFDSRGTNINNRNMSTMIDPIVADKFWDFSLDDQSLVDLPSLINFVLAKTNSQKIVYVGFSESTLFLFSLLSTMPEYADKVAAAVCMAPVAYVGHLKGLTAPLLMPLMMTPDFIHSSYLPQPLIDALDLVMNQMCRQQIFSNMICGSFSDIAGGKGSGEHRSNFYDQFFKSTSLKAVKHFLQLFLTNRFGMYDHGPMENMRRYKQPTPPNYDLSKIRSDRIILARGLNDYLSTPEDQARLLREMGTKPFRDFVIPPYNHFDFVDGKDIIRLLNGPSVNAIYQLLYKDGPNILKGAVELAPVVSDKQAGAVASASVAQRLTDVAVQRKDSFLGAPKPLGMFLLPNPFIG